MADNSESHWDTNWEPSPDMAGSASTRTASSGSSNQSGEFDDLGYADNFTESQALESYLAEALPLLFPLAADLKVAERLCLQLDEAGYFVGDLSDT